jgi:hypothetical protein
MSSDSGSADWTSAISRAVHPLKESRRCRK